MPTRHHYRQVHHLRAAYRGQVDLFTSFWLAAHWVWERRGVAKHTGMPFAEETITDTVLLDLATQNPNEIKIFPFNKRREGETGADWEWCFYDLRTSTFQRMLVQAKILDDKDRDYSHIDRVIGSTGIRQIDRLIATSAARNTPAIFVFYNHVSDRNRIPAGVCGSFDCTECWGCSVALADAVRSTLPAKDFDALKDHSKPWVCLLCQGLVSSNSAPARVLATLRDLYDRSRRIFRARDISFENVIPPPDRPSSEPPRYFDQLTRIEDARNPAERDSILAQIERENPEIDGIVLATDQSIDEDRDHLLQRSRAR